MYWSRVKTILIILFLCINIFLLVYMMISANQTIMISVETVQNTVEVLKKNDIVISSEKIPTKMKNFSFLKVQNMIQDMDEFAQKILGSEYKKQNNENFIQYISGTKTLEIRGCRFTFRDLDPSNDVIDMNPHSVERYARKVLETFKYNTKHIVTSRVEERRNGSYYLTFNQQYDGKVIFDSDIIVEVTPMGLSFIEGYALVPQALSDDKLPGRQVTSILIEFIRNENRPKNTETIIKDLSVGYFIYAGGDIVNFKEGRAAPVWRITTSDGQVYFYDAIMTNQY